MRFREWILAIVFTSIGGSTVFGQCVGGWCPRPSARRVVVYQRPTVVYVPVVQAVPRAVATPQAWAAPANDAGAFLARLNAWRARHGRHPIGWDATLAAYAASNAGVHAPGSSGGAAQCWASHRSLVAALDAWIASPAHASILLNASVAVGASPCPSGSTCNAR